MDISALLNTIITLFLLMSVGFVANKIGIIDEKASKKLSKLIISIGQPCLIVSGLLKIEYSKENLKLGLTTLLLGFLFHIVMSLIAFFACRPIRDLDQKKLSEFMMLFGNVGFLGFPIYESLFGAKGLFMGAFLIVSFNITLWTWGIAILARKRTDIKMTVKKVFINYGTVPSAIGIALFLININIPKFLLDTTGYLANLCTPISTLIIGALLGRSQLLKIFTTLKIYYVTVMRLIVIPIVICLLAKLLGLSTELSLFFTASCAMPSATNVSMLAELYNIDPEYSAQAVGMTSILSIVTIPVIMMAAKLILNV